MSTEKPMSAFEKINPGSSEKASHFDSHNLQVGGGDWAAITGKYVKPVDDGFSIDFGGDKSNDGSHMAHMLEAPGKGKAVRSDSPASKVGDPDAGTEFDRSSPAYRAHARQVIADNAQPVKAAADPDAGTEFDHNSPAYRAHARQVVADSEAQPRTTGSEYGDYLRSITPKSK